MELKVERLTDKTCRELKCIGLKLVAVFSDKERQSNMATCLQAFIAGHFRLKERSALFRNRNRLLFRVKYALIGVLAAFLVVNNLSTLRDYHSTSLSSFRDRYFSSKQSAVVYHASLPNGTTHWPYYVTKPSRICLDSETEKVFIGVLSGGAASYRPRRDSVRQTWATWANELGMEVKFFVDLPEGEEDRNLLLSEMKNYTDIELLNLPSEKSPRQEVWYFKAMWVMQYGLSHGNFSYLIRTDDDSFWCLHRLRYILNFMPPRNLIMAHYLNGIADVQFVVSRDVASQYVLESKFGENIKWIGRNMGLKNIELHTCGDTSMTFGKHHTGNLEVEGWLAPEELSEEKQRDFCKNFLANHQDYPERMRHVYGQVKSWAKTPCDAMYREFRPPTCSLDLSSKLAV
jgi:hypothetical protein